jgi:hypothetical protein
MVAEESGTVGPGFGRAREGSIESRNDFGEFAGVKTWGLATRSFWCLGEPFGLLELPASTGSCVGLEI